MTTQPDVDSGSTQQVLKRLELDITIKLDGLLQGNYLGLVPGHGSEPGETRRYAAGDDVRRIDWNVTARMQTPYVRESIADRELETRVLVDLSPSLDFGTGLCEKRDLVLASTAAVGFLTNRIGNRFGSVMLHDGKMHQTKPRAGRDHVRSLLHRIQTADRVDQANTELGAGIARMAATARRAGLMVIISDFLSDDSWSTPLKRLAVRHQVLCIEVIDPRELEMPNVGLITVVDPESGRLREVNTADAKMRARYAAEAQAQRNRHALDIQSAGAEHLVLRTDRPWLIDLVRFVTLRRRLNGAGR